MVFAQTEIMYKNRIMKDRKEIAFYSDDFDRELTEENEYSYPHKTDTQIMDALRGQKANDISLLLNIFLEQTAQFSDDSIITAFMQLIAHANKVVSDIVVRECVLQAADFETVRNILNDLKDRDLIKEWLNSLFSKYLEILSEGKDKKKEAVIEAAKDYIAGHYKDENLTVDDVAGNVGLSTNYLRSIFKKYEGIGVGEYILDVRLNHVYRMLRDTNLSIHQISRENGFANTNYFFTVFKKKTGMTPDQYRKSSSDV